MIVVVTKFLTRFGIRGLTLFPFVLVGRKADTKDVVLLNHERIHLRQQLELLVLPFYVWYVVELLARRLGCATWHEAYRQICFEREAYENEENLDFLMSRLFWNFIR